jgi:hypothetical protein
MSNDEHIALLKQGVAAWNAWRDANPQVGLDLTEANLAGRTSSGRTSPKRASVWVEKKRDMRFNVLVIG